MMSGPFLAWPYRKRLTCSVWAFGQWLLYGGKILPSKSRVPFLFHMLWSPDGEHWFGYVPNERVLTPWYRVLKHSVWFEGHIKEEKPRPIFGRHPNAGQEKPRAAGPKREP